MRSATLVLALHSARRLRPILAGVIAVLAAFQFLLVQVAGYMLHSGGFTLMPSLVPDFIQQMAGPSMLGLMSYQGLVAFGYFHPMVIASHLALAIAVGTEPAAEVEMRFADLTLARPVARHQIITRTIVVLIAAEGLVLLAMVASTWTGLACCTPADALRPAADTIRSLALMLGAVAICWGGIAVAAAAAARRRASAVGAVALAALATYLLDYLGRIWEPARIVSRLSPFHYFDPATLVTGAPLDLRHLAMLVAIGVAGAATAYILFARRDL